MSLKNFLTLTAFALVLTGCASMGLEKATSLNDRLVYAEGQYHAALDATDSSLKQGEISAVTAQSIVAQADDANLILKAAQKASAVGDTSTAEGKLAEALVSLQALQDYLRTQGAKK